VKRVAGWLAGLAAAFLCQVALSRWAPAASGRLDLLLIVVVYYGSSGAQIAAMLAGASAGLLQDFWFGALMGRNGFQKVLTGYLVGAVGSRFALESPLTRALCLAIAVAVDHLAGLGLGFLLGVPVAEPISWLLAQKMAATAAAGWVVFALERRMRRGRERRASLRWHRTARGLRAVR